jgi:transposase-like protein
MSREQPAVYTQEFKLSAVQRMASEGNVAALAKELVRGQKPRAAGASN